MKISFNQHRIIAGILLVLYLPISADFLFGFGYLGGYDRYIFGGATAVFLLYLTRFSPSLSEVQDFSDRRDLERYGRVKDRTWQVYVLTLIVAVVLLFAMGTGGRLVRRESLQEGDWLTFLIIAGLIPFVLVKSLQSLREGRDADEE